MLPAGVAKRLTAEGPAGFTRLDGGEGVPARCGAPLEAVPAIGAAVVTAPDEPVTSGIVDLCVGADTGCRWPELGLGRPDGPVGRGETGREGGAVTGGRGWIGAEADTGAGASADRRT
jgi:hypothetical protein